ncbi:MAG: hypothetical protein ACKVP2_17505 [Burkholderiales bacterium]
MGADFSYDPVTALDEASATGETAAIFADIRQTMGIPLLTSIWRGLAGIGTSLPKVWALAKPIYLSGLPDVALARVIARTRLPMPSPLAPTQLACVGIGPRDLDNIRAIVFAYNRSNGLNLAALAALVTPPGKEQAKASPRISAPPWPPLRPLLPREGIDDNTWNLIRHVNAFGASGIDASVATLWRHLAHWPGLLALAYTAFAPLQASGTITAAAAQVVTLAKEEGARMAHLRPATLDLPREAHDTLADYVNQPPHVSRMVTLGHALAQWLTFDGR